MYAFAEAGKPAELHGLASSVCTAPRSEKRAISATDSLTAIWPLGETARSGLAHQEVAEVGGGEGELALEELHPSSMPLSERRRERRGESSGGRHWGSGPEGTALAREAQLIYH